MVRDCILLNYYILCQKLTSLLNAFGKIFRSHATWSVLHTFNNDWFNSNAMVNYRNLTILHIVIFESIV